jgi:transposase-like protein
MNRDGRSLDHKTLAELRRMAVRRVLEDGESPSAVAASYGFCRNAVYPSYSRREKWAVECFCTSVDGAANHV